ncbi:MAG TPA: glycosyltransferase family 4 protein [Clostridia bacterium]|nr:glycosyltransferase family 4 protein [Clostridia bacterium]
MIFVSFYTEDTIYEDGAERLEQCFKKFNLKYHIQPLNLQNKTWQEICAYRGQFLCDMMDKYHDDVCWIDADATIEQYPENLLNIPKEIDMAFHFRNGQELMMGTSYFRNCQEVRKLLLLWTKTVDPYTTSISQAVFSCLLHSSKYKFNIANIDESYCHIFDTPQSTKHRVEPAVIVHHQFSRQRNSKQSTYRSKRLLEKSKINLPKKGNLPRVALAVNLNGWAFQVRCENLKTHLSKRFDLDIVNPCHLHRIAHNYDLIYFPTYESIQRYKNVCHKICSTVAGLVVNSLNESIPKMDGASAIIVPNRSWYNAYTKLKVAKPALYYIPHGVDTKLFKPTNLNNHPFTIGWAGNDTMPRAKVKRIQELRDICKKLNIPLVERNFGKNQVPHDEMPNFYNSIDLYVNLSTTEGSNNCILEACSCGVQVLGTPVGNMPELAEHGALLVKPDLSDLVEKIKMVKDTPKHHKKLHGLRLRQCIVNNLSVKHMANAYGDVFDYCLKEK